MSARAEKRARVKVRPGFTLIELLVVIAIIAALAAVVAPAVFRNVGDARSTAAKAQLEVFALALAQYRTDTDYYPTTSEGLAALRESPSDLGVDGNDAAKWRGPYLMRPVPLDPWGRPYVYLSPGVRDTLGYDLYSLGRDQRTGGKGEDADLTSWAGPADATAASSTAR